MSLSDSFYDYARLSEGLRQTLGYKGPEVISTIDSTSGFDATISYIDAEIDTTSVYEGLDQPGKSGGEVMNLTNSLSNKAGTPRNIAVPVEVDEDNTAVPDHSVGSTTESSFDFLNINPDLQGKLVAVRVQMYNPDISLDTDGVSIEYYNGSEWLSLYETEKYWDGSLVKTYYDSLPENQSYRFKIRVTLPDDFPTGTRYYYYVKATVDGEDYPFIEFRREFSVTS